MRGTSTEECERLRARVGGRERDIEKMKQIQMVQSCRGETGKEQERDREGGGAREREMEREVEREMEREVEREREAGGYDSAEKERSRQIPNKVGIAKVRERGRAS